MMNQHNPVSLIDSWKNTFSEAFFSRGVNQLSLPVLKGLSEMAASTMLNRSCHTAIVGNSLPYNYADSCHEQRKVTRPASYAGFGSKH